MYTNYFGFSEKPFTLTPNPRFIFLSKNHSEAFGHLLYGINNNHGFITLVGEVGTGKTTLLRSILEQLHKQNYRTALVFNPCITGIELLQSINQEFGIDYNSNQAAELLNTLNRFLISENSTGHPAVLIIDEAQNLKPEVLEQIRLISNLETDNDKLIQIILSGQPELKKLLKKTELRQLNQRIAVRFTLKPLDRDETAAYIRHRIVTAGEDSFASFSDKALLLIHMYTGGIPRMINILCDRSLLIAYSFDQHNITAGTVLKAIWEIKELPTLKRSEEYRPAEPKKKSRRKSFFFKQKPSKAEKDMPETVQLSTIEPQSDIQETDLLFDETQFDEDIVDLVEELRMEMEEDRPELSEIDSLRGNVLLQSMTEELNATTLKGGILLLVLRFASEYLNRAVIFMVNGNTISGYGQFGIDDGTINGDEAVRAINFSPDSDSMFRNPYLRARAATFKPEPTSVNTYIYNKLGGKISDEAFIGPIVSRSRVIGFLYGDNLPENKPIGSTETVEIFLSQAGAAIGKHS